MTYLEFVEKAIAQDSRNVFAKYDGNLDVVPDTLRIFYKEKNPLDVEINFTRFISADKLAAIQTEYHYLNAQFVFATCNGDPVFLHDGCIYTVPHGIKEPKWELLAKDIETYYSTLLLD